MSSVFAPFTKAPDFSPPVREPEPGTGLFDLPGNLLNDLTDAAVGIPGGVVHMFRDPEDALSEVIEGTWHTWSPLFKGEFGKWFDQTMAHPLAPILDLSAFVTGGATLGAKAAARVGAGTKVVRRVEHGEVPSVDVGKAPGEAFELGDWIEGLDKAEATMPARIVEEVVPKTDPDSLLGRFIAFSRHEEQAFDPFTGERITPGRMEYHDPIGGRPVQFKPFTRKDAPVQKWVAQQQHKLSIEMSQKYPNVFGGVEGTPGIWGLRTFGQQARYERKSLQAIAGNRTALYAQLGAFMEAGKTIAQGDVKGITDFYRQSLNKSHEQMLQHGRSWEVGRELPKDRDGQEAYSYARAEPVEFDELPAGWHGDGATSLEKNLKQMDKQLTTKDLTKAARVPGDPSRAIIVPKHSLKALGIEGGNSAKFLDVLYRSPTQIWKTIMLGYAPRFFTNNMVGNFTLYMLSQGGGSAMRGLVDAYRQVWKEDRLARKLGAADQLGRFDYIRNHFSDQLAGLIESNDMQNAMMREKVGHKAGIMEKTSDRLRDTRFNLFGVTHLVADLGIRRAAINAKTREIPQVKVMTRDLVRGGMDPGKAFDTAADTFYRNNRAERDRVSQATFDIMGDYVGLGPNERIVREFVPFYSWDRHILRTTKTLARDRPVLTAWLAHWGFMGTEETQNVLGVALPDFMKGVIPFGEENGRTKILGTQGLNPFATLPDIANAAWAFALPGHKPVSNTLGSQINPLLQGGIEALTGSSLLTGEPKRDQGNFGFIGGTLANVGANFPEFTIAKRFIEGQPQPKDPSKPFLYSKSQREAIGAWLGLPLKWVDVERAEDLAQQQIKLEGG